MIEAYFIAPSYRQADFWARQMAREAGRPMRWRLLRSIQDVAGADFGSVPVYRVGSSELPRDAQEVAYYLTQIGVEVLYP